MDFYKKYIKYKNKYLGLKKSQFSIKYTVYDSELFIKTPSALWQYTPQYIFRMIFSLIYKYLKSGKTVDEIMNLFSKIPKKTSTKLAEIINERLMNNLNDLVFLLRDRADIYQKDLTIYDFENIAIYEEILKNVDERMSTTTIEAPRPTASIYRQMKYNKIKIMDKEYNLPENADPVIYEDCKDYITMIRLIKYVGVTNIKKLFLYLPLVTFGVNVPEYERDKVYYLKLKAHISMYFREPYSMEVSDIDLVSENPDKLYDWLMSGVLFAAKTTPNAKEEIYKYTRELIQKNPDCVMHYMKFCEFNKLIYDDTDLIKIKDILKMAIDVDPFIIKNLEKHFFRLKKYFNEIYEYSVRKYIQLFKKNGWYTVDFFKKNKIPKEYLSVVLEKIPLNDLLYVYIKNNDLIKYLPSKYKIFNNVLKYMCERKIKILDKTLDDLQNDDLFNTIHIKEYLMGHKIELPAYLTTEFILRLFRSKSL